MPVNPNEDLNTKAPDPTLDAPGAWPAAGSDWIEHAGSVIGPYKLQQRLGEGGMGTVWLAEQTVPVQRKVALKLIRPDLGGNQFLARFEAERQALALMDHPNIARVLDAGATANGRPFLVMELVKGQPLTEYCDKHKLTPRERLELFVLVCQATQHAHQKGIIHRDLKPSNVLVADYDGKAVPKIIDFGLAKALGQKLTDKSMFTGLRAVVGTLEYMSPEQAEPNPLDIDTRTDIYALGVMLYELLTGSTPLTRQRLHKAELVEVLRVIRDEDPPKPSLRLSDSKESLPSIAAQRKLEPAKLARIVRGELDWVVMKALEKDRNRRYETANAFAVDIQRYLHDDPVFASPPSAVYRLRKFAKRNKGPLAAAALVLLALVGGIVGTTLGLWTATEQRDRAITAELESRLNEQKAKEEEGKAKASEQNALAKEAEAKRAAADALAVLQFFQDKVLSAARPRDQEGGLGIDATIRAAVDAAEPKIAESFKEHPLIEASLRNVLGSTYLYLGEARLAVKQLEIALALRKAKLAPDHSDTLSSMNNLALAYQAAGRKDDALHLIEEELKLRQANSNLSIPDTLANMQSLAMSYQQLGRLNDSIELLEGTLKLSKAKLGSDHRVTLVCMHNLASAYQAVGQLDKAIPLLEESLKLFRAKFGDSHPDTLISINNLALAYQSAGRLMEALPLLEETLKHFRAKLGDGHPDTLTSMNNLAIVYQSAGRFNDSLPLLEESLKLFRAKLGDEHPKTLTSIHNLASTYQDARRFGDAVQLYEELLKLQKKTLGAEHPDTLTTMNNLAAAYHLGGRLNDALPLYEETLKLRKSKLGPGHADTINSMDNLGQALEDAGRFSDAEPIWRELAALWKDKAGADSIEYASELAIVGLNLLKQVKPADAEPFLRDCLAIRGKKQPDDWTTFNTQSMLGSSLLGQKKYADAEPLLLQGYEGMKQRAAKIPPPALVRVIEAIERLIEISVATGRDGQAENWRIELEAVKSKISKK